MGNTSSILLASVGSAGLTLVLTPLVGMMAQRLGIVDVPNVRKVHRRPIPRTGGLAIGIAVLAGILAGSTVAVAADWPRLIPLLIGAASVLIVGVIDDICEL